MLNQFYKLISFATILVFLGHMSSRAAVTNWWATKGVDYVQYADNTEPAASTNWSVFSVVETDMAGDATSVVLTGGNITGTVAYVQTGTTWELAIEFSSKAALDAVYPSSAAYEIILSGGSLGTVTQQFSAPADAYPNTPYLTGADYSDLQALEVLEPFEFNWSPADDMAYYAIFEISEGAIGSDGDLVTQYDPGTAVSNVVLPEGTVQAGSNYTGYVEYVYGADVSGAGGFGVDGQVSFNTGVAFPVSVVNTAVGYDDFNDNSFDLGKWTSLSVEAGKAFTETNQRLEYTSVGSVDGDSVAWGWGASALSYTQDWSIAIDIANLIDSGAIAPDGEIYTGLGVFHNSFNHLFEIELFKNEFVSVLYSAGTNGTTGIEKNIFAPTNQVSVKISFDADTKTLYSAYSTGGDYTIVTNYPIVSWGMTDASVFTVGFFGGSHLNAVSGGQVYVDNFRIYDGPMLTNNVGLTELEFLHSYGDGFIFLPNNFIQVDTLSTHRIREVSFTTSGGLSASLTNVWDAGIGVEWGIEIPLGFSTSWDPANDGDWIVTFGFIDGTYQSAVIPFTLEDGATPIPNIFYPPAFLPPSPANNSFTTNTSISFGWTAAGSNTVFLSVDEIVNGNEVGDLSMVYTNGLAAASFAVLGITNAQPITITNAGPFAFAEGFHRMRINEGNGHAAYNSEGLLYTVVKQNEADIIFTVAATLDGDGDGMDDNWEILYFGSTNAVNGGPLDNWDGDKYSNLDEYIVGSDPTNSGSGLQFQPVGEVWVGSSPGSLPEYRIDMGDTAPYIGPGGNWNSISYGTLNAGSVALKDYNSGSTSGGVTLRTLQPVQPLANSGIWNGATSEDWVSFFAGKDLLYSADYMALAIEGLDPAKQYRVEVLAAWDFSAAPVHQVHVIVDTAVGDPSRGYGWWPTSTYNGTSEGTGNNSLSKDAFEPYQHGWVDANWLIWEGAVPGRHNWGAFSLGADAIALYIENDDVNRWGAINAIRIVEEAPASIPGFVLSWNAFPGRLYSISWTDSLTNSLQPLVSGIAYPQNSYTDTVHSAVSEGFYALDVSFE